MKVGPKAQPLQSLGLRDLEKLDFPALMQIKDILEGLLAAIPLSEEKLNGQQVATKEWERLWGVSTDRLPLRVKRRSR
jgi:hypothetical protein